MNITIKRIYDPPADGDGLRVLVDRLWPRGVRKEDAALDLWWKDIAPTPDLRQWFGHKVNHWEDFKERYADELHGHTDLIETFLADNREQETITLLYAAKDTQHNHAIVLQSVMREIAPKAA